MKKYIGPVYKGSAQSNFLEAPLKYSEKRKYSTFPQSRISQEESRPWSTCGKNFEVFFYYRVLVQITLVVKSECRLLVGPKRLGSESRPRGQGAYGPPEAGPCLGGSYAAIENPSSSWRNLSLVIRMVGYFRGPQRNSIQ